MALLPFPNNQTPPDLAAALGANPPEAQPTDALNSIISGFFNDARARLNSQDFGSVFNDMLNTVQNQPAPTQLPVPAPLHPVGQLAAVFASTLAEQLGARGAVNAQQERAGLVDQRRQQAQQTNILRQDEFEQRKATQELNIRMKINEARAQQAKEMGDLNEYEARLKTQASMRREQIKMQEDAKLKGIEAQNKAILDRVSSEIAQRGNEARKTINYRKMLNTALDTTKASDALKLWGQLQKQKIFSRDITGEYVYTPEQQEKMSEETYQEFLRRKQEESSAASDTTETKPTGDAFDSFIESLFSE